MARTTITSSTNPTNLVVLPAPEVPVDDRVTPLSSGSSNTDEGSMRYRHIEDIMRDAQRVDLDEDVEEEVMLVETEEPSCYCEAAGQQVWEDTMAKEIESIEKNNTWTLTVLPAGHKPIGLK